MSPPRQRVLDLLKVQSRIFSHTFNPTQARQGTSILRQRLKGPSVASYYPRRHATIQTLLGAMKKGMPDLELEMIDEKEWDRFEHIAQVKNRGKGAPKKKRTAAGEKIGEGWDGEEKERAREADEIEVKYEDMESKQFKGAKKKKAAATNTTGGTTW